MITTNNLVLKSVYELLTEKFFVPSYQRGYRWKEQQVSDLLNDIWEFSQIVKSSSSNKEQPFYCLQPVVVKARQDGWEVIDGQQRLTTILIILKYYNNHIYKTPKNIFQLQYETRDNSKTFLENINKDQKDENIDYFHMYSALETVEKWFANRTKIDTFYDSIVSDTKFIWYEVNETIDPIDVFTRINIGKIPLTNSELIKALFLREKNFGTNEHDEIRLKQLQIATEWDRIELTLQNDSFWFFIFNGQKKYQTRIEFIFDLMQEKKNDDEYYTFHKFQEIFESEKDIDKTWKRIKDYFLTFEEWYRDRLLYHLIGFLIDCGENIEELKKESRNKTKTEFRVSLRRKIKAKIKCEIDDLDYETSNQKLLIRRILLLFNLETILLNDNTDYRFPFDKYKKDHWDIEHIRARKDIKPANNIRERWLKEILNYFIGRDDANNVSEDDIKELGNEKEIVQDIVNILSDKTISEGPFDNLYNKLLSFFDEADNPENINSISNLTLLDSGTNRSYKNSMFPIKRSIILEKDKNGSFIPICTKNVFLKYYSKKIDRMLYWSKSDAEDYLHAIKRTLTYYFN